MPQTLFEGRFLRVVREKHWEYVERTNARCAVVIAALTTERRLVLIEQFRIPVAAQVIELPAGLVGDDPAHDPADLLGAAQRELLEETGYESAEWAQVAIGPISAGLTTEECAFFTAFNARRVAAGGGIEHERIDTHEVALDALDAWLDRKSATGCKIDPKVYLGELFAKRAR